MYVSASEDLMAPEGISMINFFTALQLIVPLIY